MVESQGLFTKKTTRGKLTNSVISLHFMTAITNILILTMDDMKTVASSKRL